MSDTDKAPDQEGSKTGCSCTGLVVLAVVVFLAMAGTKIAFRDPKKTPMENLVTALAPVLGINVHHATERALVSRTRHDLRVCATAIEAYFIENTTYPPTRPLVDSAPGARPKIEQAGGRNLETMAGLTTPISYLTSYLPDPSFSPENVPFAYARTTNSWLLLSPGPDLKFNIDPKRDWEPEWGTTVTEQMLLLSYDPTNGSISPGDVWRMKQ